MKIKNSKLILILGVSVFFVVLVVGAQGAPRYTQDLYFGIKNSLVSTLQSDLSTDPLVRRNTFGCGSHQPTGIIFKVTRTGKVQRIAFENEKPSSGPILCVD